ncbi:unnamed protein product [Ambrosiozyma monospora]|nr:unnamed protein product [Ambrosiozyma monospora]
MYPFDYNYDDLLTDEEKQFNDDIRSLLPFAVIGSEEVITTPTGEKVRGRRTKWGFINVEDVTQCEFVYLRDFLTRTHLFDLIETTAMVHYETFRSKQLTALRENVGSRTSQLAQTATNASANASTANGQPISTTTSHTSHVVNGVPQVQA